MANIKKLEKKVDERGWLAELLRPEDTGQKEFGQLYVTIAKPGITKGNHWHKRKKEWFIVIRGQAELLLRDLSTGQEEKIQMNGDDLSVVEIEPGILHAITNTGKNEMHLLAYISESFKPNDPDTYYLDS